LVRIATFNINNINKRLDNLLAWLAKTEPDVVSLQELKVEQGAFPVNALRTVGYEAVWQGERSWNGVAILARNHVPVLTCASLPGNPEDHQARYIEAAVQGVLITSIYLPNGNPQPGPKFKYKWAWFERLIARAAELIASGAPVVLAGDYNVVPTPQDIYPTRSLDNNALIQPESRQAFARLLGSRLDRRDAETTSRGAALDFLGLQIRSVAEGQRHATRSLSALAEVVGPPRGRWCRPVGARAD
jgi:exodeoxyribonuclease-3